MAIHLKELPAELSADATADAAAAWLGRYARAVWPDVELDGISSRRFATRHAKDTWNAGLLARLVALEASRKRALMILCRNGRSACRIWDDAAGV